MINFDESSCLISACFSRMIHGWDSYKMRIPSERQREAYLAASTPVWSARCAPIPSGWGNYHIVLPPTIARLQALHLTRPLLQPSSRVMLIASTMNGPPWANQIRVRWLRLLAWRQGGIKPWATRSYNLLLNPSRHALPSHLGFGFCLDVPKLRRGF